MNALVFGYAMRLRDDLNRNELLEGLPAQARTDVEAAFEQTEGLSGNEIRKRLHAHRVEQCLRQRKEAGARTGLNLDSIAPQLAEWLARPF